MRFAIILLLCITLLANPAAAVELTFEEDTQTQAVEAKAPTERASIQEKTVTVPEAMLDAGRVRKTVVFRGNKSARFAEFENLDLAPQQIYAKGLLNSAVAIDDQGVVNYAELPEVNDTAVAVERVETKVTARVPNNPAIAGYGRAKRDLYGALRAKRAQDARDNAQLMAKLDQFQVTEGRMQEKLRRASTDGAELVAYLR